jgi:class 3 adenylate cyclase/tetratricopeptide (TPR) repeat protein
VVRRRPVGRNTGPRSWLNSGHFKAHNLFPKRDTLLAHLAWEVANAVIESFHPSLALIVLQTKIQTSYHPVLRSTRFRGSVPVRRHAGGIAVEYKPAPFDASGVNLSRDILELTELLARNAHDRWAKLRFAEGWQHGPERSDQRKEHPGLIPYDQLSEGEKDYDRQTVLEAIKTLLAMGYAIQPPAPVDRGSNASSTPVRSSELQDLEASVPQSHVTLQRLWRERDAGSWLNAPQNYKLLAKRILQIGEPLLAYDVAAEGVQRFPHNVELRQLLALALARSGAAGSANALLSELYAEGHRDEETVGLLARTHKDLAREAGGSPEAQKHLRKAFDFYAQAYGSTQGYWTGINAATLALLLGEHERAATLAEQVAIRCREELNQSESASGDRYWILSTLGETALLLRRWSEAQEWYSQALEVGHGNWGSLHSTRHNARLLAKHLGEGMELVDSLFRFPSVVMFVGHMVDQPDRQISRFPQRLEGAVKEAIRSTLRRLDPQFAYASAACGSDILFHEAMLERNGEIHVVLPYEKEFFVKDSVELVDSGDWSSRFERIMGRAVEIQEASKRSQMCGKVSFEFANLLLHGLASIHAQQLDTKLIPLGIWDGKPGDGPGGTAGTIERWRAAGLDVEIIDLAKILAEDPLELSPSTAMPIVPHRPRSNTSSTEFVAEIRALLFADAEGFSKLSDEEVPRFVEHFLGLAGTLAEESAHTPLVKNTWGDGLYFVFAHVREAGLFALELRDRVRRTDWAARGLPNLNLRIGLHAGPVYLCTDPVTQRGSCIGAHVSRAARIEPITPIGQVYASQPFAALAAAHGVAEFSCAYVGQTSMAKKYGNFPTYVVARRQESS